MEIHFESSATFVLILHIVQADEIGMYHFIGFERNKTLFFSFFFVHYFNFIYRHTQTYNKVSATEP
jgi:hypothetical protein